MTSIRCLAFLLLLLCHRVHSEAPEPMFRTRGSNIELGYCFGVDYILVYRSSPEGDQLLGNSSDSAAPVAPPADLRGRVHVNKQELLLGLQIVNLTHADSANYRRECWQNRTLVVQVTQQLSVCNEEVDAEEIIVREEEEWTELLCGSGSMGLEGISVRWYQEMYPSYKTTLILDTSVSLEPLVKELQNRTKVKASGLVLVVESELLNNNQQYFCLVIKGENCLAFQNMYLPVQSENREIYASAGERVVLYCPSDGHNLQWDTPLGNINGSGITKNQLQIRKGDEDFSLVIPSVSDEHNGHYSCISSALEMQYSLVLCPKKEPSAPQTVVQGQQIVIDCDAGDDRVQWFHRRSREHVMELIHDSKAGTDSVPEDLKGRLSLSKKGSSLEITNSVMNDGGVYSCVVLREPEFVLIDYDSDYGDNFTVGDYEDDPEWEDSYGCILKQDTTLTVKTGTRVETEKKTNLTPHILGAGLGGLVLLVGVIVAVILVRRRVRKRKEEQNNQERNATEQPMLAT